MKIATVNREMLQQLNELTEKIRKNIATTVDYGTYENLLIKSGAFTHNEINSYLTRANINSYPDLIEARNRAKTIEAKKQIEGVAVVGLVALGLALILGAASNSKK